MLSNEPQTLQSLTVRRDGVVYTRLLGNPKSFDGTSHTWRRFKFTFHGCAGAVDSTSRP